MAADERVVEREIVLDAGASEVWEALTDERLLSEWMADEAELEASPGGRAAFRFEDGTEREGTVIEMQEERSLAFSWTRQGGSESIVEFRLEPVIGGTRLVVAERGALAMRLSAGAEWTRRLRAFVAAITLVPA